MRKLKNDLELNLKDFNVSFSNKMIRIKHKIKNFYKTRIYIKKLTSSYVSIYSGEPKKGHRILSFFHKDELKKIRNVVISYFNDIDKVVPIFIESVKKLFEGELGNIDKLLVNPIRHNKIRYKYKYFRHLSNNNYSCSITEGGEGIVKWYKNDFKTCMENFFCLKNDNYIIDGYRFNPTFFNDMYVLKFWDKITGKVIWKKVYASHVYNNPVAFQCCKILAKK